MKNEKKNIIRTTDSNSPEMMIEYLKGNNAALQQHETEEKLMSDPFISDALEGLYGKLNNNELNKVQNKLNNFIDHRIKKQSKKANKIILFPVWIVLLSIVLLLISIAGYVLVRFLLK
jgi:hypothetical protein